MVPFRFVRSFLLVLFPLSFHFLYVRVQLLFLFTLLWDHSNSVSCSIFKDPVLASLNRYLPSTIQTCSTPGTVSIPLFTNSIRTGYTSLINEHLPSTIQSYSTPGRCHQVQYPARLGDPRPFLRLPPACRCCLSPYPPLSSQFTTFIVPFSNPSTPDCPRMITWWTRPLAAT